MFKDVNPKDWFYSAVKNLVRRRVINGYEMDFQEKPIKAA